MRINIIITLFILLTINSFGQNSIFDYDGYVKDLVSTTKFPFSPDRYYDNLVHARLNTHWYPTSSLTGEFDLRMRAYYGGTVEHTPGFLDQIKSHHQLTQLDAVLWNEKKSVGYLEADRLYFTWYHGGFDITVGRQRIAWGTSWVWNPTDLFNPLSPLNFDYEEGPGVDAVRAEYFYGPISKFEIAVRPGKTKNGWIGAGKWTTNFMNYDFNLLGGITDNRWVAGGSWSGSILKAGFRGEFTVKQKPTLIPDFKNIYFLIGGTPLSLYNEAVVTGVLSGDYTFPNSFYIHTEVLYNSNGKTKDAGVYTLEASKLGMLSPSRWSLYQEFAYDITPLIRGDLFALYNPDDNSSVVLPSLSYSVVTNVDLYIIGLFFQGKQLTEFGDYGTSIYLRVKWSF
jgi:hypothetical protein